MTPLNTPGPQPPSGKEDAPPRILLGRRIPGQNYRPETSRDRFFRTYGLIAEDLTADEKLCDILERSLQKWRMAAAIAIAFGVIASFVILVGLAAPKYQIAATPAGVWLLNQRSGQIEQVYPGSNRPVRPAD